MTKPKVKKERSRNNLSNESGSDLQDVKPAIQAISFKAELALVLHSLGDVARPLKETAALLDEIVHQQISQLILMAYDVAVTRGSNAIGHEDFLYLLRKNKTKLRRLFNCLYLKAVKKPITDTVNDDSLPERENESQKKLESCKRFLESIDNTGEFEAVYENLGEDNISYRRNYVAYNGSKYMDDSNYLNFSKARQFSFTKHMKTFQMWFAPVLDSIPMKPNKFGWELLAYFAHETASEIVECSLIVQQENHGVTPISGEHSLLMKHAIHPYHIQEVMRRFVDNVRPSTLFSRPNFVPFINRGLIDISCNTPCICLL